MSELTLDLIGADRFGGGEIFINPGLAGDRWLVVDECLVLWVGVLHVER
jgi:hypothetical protein